MRAYKFASLALGLLLLTAAVPASAHGGGKEGAYHMTVQAGNLPVVIDFADWPLRAQKSNRFIVAPDGGIAGREGTMTWTDSNRRKRLDANLMPYPGLKDVWMVETKGIKAPGDYTVTIEIYGSGGDRTATLPLSVGPPPGIPLWFGWLVGLFPLYGMVWFMLRERRRVRALQVAGVVPAAQGGSH